MPYEIAPTTSFTDEEHAQELLNELLEDGHDEDEMKGFIEIFGSKAFYQNYEDYKLHDEINIGYDVEDDDLPEEIEEDSWIDGLLTSGFHAVNDDELFGEEIVGYSLY